MTGRASRRKGHDYERDVVAWLRLHGWPLVERRLSGACDDRGDVTGWPGVVIDTKNRKTIDLAGWVDQLGLEMTACTADTGVIVAKRRGIVDVGAHYAIQTVAGWAALMKEAGR